MNRFNLEEEGDYGRTNHRDSALNFAKKLTNHKALRTDRGFESIFQKT